MPTRIHPKKLLVEGDVEKRVIPELIEANGVTWGETGDEAVVFIKQFEGISNLLKPGVIEAELKASGAAIVGILVDADDDAAGRFEQIRRRSQSQFPKMPDSLPADGLIHANEEGLKLGVWLMPDNESRGMLETFLTFLASDEDGLVRYADRACKHARRKGAPYKEIDSAKAKIHTWLAWQDEPGAQLHQAVKYRVLNPALPHAAPFVTWFRRLFEV